MMSSQIEMNETEERLNRVEIELVEARDKYKKLEKTSYSNRLLGDELLCKAKNNEIGKLLF